jgi:hypothetical protein
MPAELGALVKVLFATETPLMRQEMSSPDIAPAVVTGTTAQVRKPRPPRRQLVLLAAGAVLAATLGAGLGWVGNRVGLASVGRLGDRNAVAGTKNGASAAQTATAAQGTTAAQTASAAQGATAAQVAMGPPAGIEAIAPPAPPADQAAPTTVTRPRFAPVPAQPAVVSPPVASEDDDRAATRKAAAVARRLRRQQRLKSNPF